MVSKLHDAETRTPTCEGIYNLQPLSLLPWDFLVTKSIAPLNEFSLEGLDLHLFPDEIEVSVDVFFLDHHIRFDFLFVLVELHPSFAR